MYLKVDRLVDGCGGFFFCGCIINVIILVKYGFDFGIL